MSPDGLEERPDRGRFPRVSGDEPSKSAVLVFFGSFSPRERG